MALEAILRSGPAKDSDTSRYWELWRSLVASIATYQPDVVVLVARKMPRLFELLRPELAQDIICISDQAIPFARKDIQNARVAIVDDVWNVGTTIDHALRQLERCNPGSIRLFALAAKDPEKAADQGVDVTVSRAMPDRDRRSFASSVARALRFVSKPFDGDFPLIECRLRRPYGHWQDVWPRLLERFGDRAFSLTDSQLERADLARATIRIDSSDNWTIKARLYFDFAAGSCNVVPMALSSPLPLDNCYPDGTLPHRVFEAITSVLPGDRATPENRDAVARAQTYCDGLLIAPDVLGALEDFVTPAAVPPSELRLQFGSEVTVLCADELVPGAICDPLAANGVLNQRAGDQSIDSSLFEDERISSRAASYLASGLSLHAFDALLSDLASTVGADDPARYDLLSPYTPAEIRAEPYLRLRIGFTARGLQRFLGAHPEQPNNGRRSSGALLSDLLDVLVDKGAVVPTFTASGSCARIYRKGESDAELDALVNRIAYAVDRLPPGILSQGGTDSRTRLAKLIAIIAYSGKYDDGVSLAAVERGVVPVVARSGIEREAIELTKQLEIRGLVRLG